MLDETVPRKLAGQRSATERRGMRTDGWCAVLVQGIESRFRAVLTGSQPGDPGAKVIAHRVEVRRLGVDGLMRLAEKSLG